MTSPPQASPSAQIYIKDYGKSNKRGWGRYLSNVVHFNLNIKVNIINRYALDTNELLRLIPGVIKHTSRPNQCLAYYIDRSKKTN